MTTNRAIHLSVTLRCEAAKLPSLEGRRPPSFEARFLGSHLRMTAGGSK